MIAAPPPPPLRVLAQRCAIAVSLTLAGVLLAAAILFAPLI